MRPSRLCLFLAVLSLCLAPALSQQPASSTRAAIDETHLSTLRGTVHPLAQPRYDRGPVDPSFRAGRILLTLARPAGREQALQQFLKDAHTAGSPAFHQWLTPDQFGNRFGALDEDRAIVTDWLQSHGLTVTRIAANRTALEFSGTAAQIGEALHTEIHRYVFNGKTAAGGGGVSNCSQETAGTTSTPACISGYPKPSWQNAPGVPNDSARDLPDLSLFAANGPNLTAWPICADPGDCDLSSTGSYHIFLVGGTSASSPAMAGIMALIDQKYGRQGQANYTLYSLARTDPSVFHDIAFGTNDVLCLGGQFFPTPGCTNLLSIPAVQDYSYGVYPAGPGYDLATGLGTIDAGKLFAAWNSTPGTATATTLQVSPATFVHGAAAAVTVAVTASSGSAIPTGNVALTTTNIAAALRNNPAIALTDGTASASLSTLPGGTYNLVAQYSGDATFAPSASSPVALTVTPEPSTTTINPVISEAVTPGSTPTAFSLSALPYGSAIYFKAVPSGANSTAGLATGTVNFTDGSTSATLPLNVNGVATWTPQVLAIGAHSIAAAYSGDASFSASTSAPLAVTVVKGTPLFEALPESSTQFNSALGQTAYTAGSNLVVHVLLRGIGFSVPPSGTVTVTLSSLTQTLPQTVTLNPNEYLNENLANAFVTFTAVPAGTYTLSATYSGDSNWNAGTYKYGQTPVGGLTGGQTALVFAATGASPTTTVLTLSPANVDSSGSVSVAATVTDTAASSTTFTGTSLGTILLFGNGTAIATLRVTAPPPGSGTPLVYTGTATIPATVFPLGTLQIVGLYLGGINDLASTSAPVPLTVTASDFSLSIAASALSIKSGQTATVPIQLAGPFGVGVPVALACATPSSAITCAINPASATVTGTASATLTLNAFTTATATGANMVPDAPGSGASRTLPGLRKAAAALALVFFLILPGRKRRSITRWTGSLLLLFIAASFAAGCSGGGGSPSNPPPPPPPTQTNATAGTYTVTVKGVSGGIEHTNAIAFQIQ